MKKTLLFPISVGIVLLGAACASGPKPVPEASVQDSQVETLWVVRSDGSKSCVKDSGQKIEVAASELTQAGVSVLGSKKTGDGKMHPMVCGSATGRQNAFQIHASDQEAAIKLGFQVATKENAPALFR